MSLRLFVYYCALIGGWAALLGWALSILPLLLIDPDARVSLHVYPRPQTLMDRLREAFALRSFGGAASPPATDPRARGIALVAAELSRGLAGFAVAFRQGPGRPIAALPWIPEIR